MRADQLLVEKGLAPTRSVAQRLIAAGVQWCTQPDGAPWQTVSKNGQDLPAWVHLRLLDTAEVRYVSRAGLKLEGALATCGLDPKGLRFLDVGQSTGGFTDCLLKQGAAQVVGLDVGHDQLALALRQHPQVVALQGVNARDPVAVRQALQTHHAAWQPGHFDGLVMDVSFISQTLVLPAVLPWVKPGGHVLSLVKPQFELSSADVGKGGIVSDPRLYTQVQQRVGQALQQLGCTDLLWLDSPILGGDGNREFFISARAALAP
jgi:23S rRNA (cytidine1920-2'-O)/16S rRNA (cytidine1409-2'-O)-methyltransferase